MTITLIIVGVILLFKAFMAWADGPRLSLAQFTSLVNCIENYLSKSGKLSVRRDGEIFYFDSKFQEATGLRCYVFNVKKNKMWLFYINKKHAHFVTQDSDIMGLTQLSRFFTLLAAFMVDKKKDSDKKEAA